MVVPQSVLTIPTITAITSILPTASMVPYLTGPDTASRCAPARGGSDLLTAHPAPPGRSARSTRSPRPGHQPPVPAPLDLPPAGKNACRGTPVRHVATGLTQTLEQTCQEWNLHNSAVARDAGGDPSGRHARPPSDPLWSREEARPHTCPSSQDCYNLDPGSPFQVFLEVRYSSTLFKVHCYPVDCSFRSNGSHFAICRISTNTAGGEMVGWLERNKGRVSGCVIYGRT